MKSDTKWCAIAINTHIFHYRLYHCFIFICFELGEDLCYDLTLSEVIAIWQQGSVPVYRHFHSTRYSVRPVFGKRPLVVGHRSWRNSCLASASFKFSGGLLQTDSTIREMLLCDHVVERWLRCVYFEKPSLFKFQKIHPASSSHFPTYSTFLTTSSFFTVFCNA